MASIVPLRSSRPVRVRIAESMAIFTVFSVLYLALAVLLVFGLQLVLGDAWTRVGNASHALLSRDPHLAAIGFVWNPLPSLLTFPLLLFAQLWPSLLREGFAANIVSAVAMAFALVQIDGLLVDWGVVRWGRLALVGAVALNPLIAFYGANGMSEALFLAAVLYTVRHLACWLDGREVGQLVRVGIGVATAYLIRYEAGAAAIAVIAIVPVASWSRARSGERGAAAQADAIIVGMPFATVFALWAAASWVFVGSPFETFTSVYGNSSQIALMSQWISLKTGQGTSAAPAFLATQVLALGPALLILPLVAIALIRAKLPTPAVAAAPLGAVLAFAAWAFLSGRSFGWLRFEIMAIPLAMIVAVGAGALAMRAFSGRTSSLAIGSLVIVLAWSGIPTTTWVMLDPLLAQEESRQLAPYVAAAAGAPFLRPPDSQIYVLGGELAELVDGLHAPRGSVLVDAATSYPLVLRSQRPQQFVIPSDRDFRAALANPGLFGLRYFVVALDQGIGTVDAINRAHTGAYENGGGVGRLVGEVSAPGLGWRVYEVVEPE